MPLPPFLLRVAEACSRFSSVESSRFFSPRNCSARRSRREVSERPSAAMSALRLEPIAWLGLGVGSG